MERTEEVALMADPLLFKPGDKVVYRPLVRDPGSQQTGRVLRSQVVGTGQRLMYVIQVDGEKRPKQVSPEALCGC